MAKPKTSKPINLKKLEPHDLGGIFPPLNDHDYEVLCDSIKAHGLKESIVLHEGAILDGNNRYTACKKVKVEPHFRDFKPEKDGSPFDFVLEKNLARRNLTPSMASIVAAKLLSTWEELEAAKDASSLNLDSKSKSKKPRAKGDKTKKAAAALGVSRASVSKAKKLSKDDPAAAEDVASGKKTLNAATQEVQKKKTKAEIESEKFDVHRLLVQRVYGVDDGKKAEATLTAKEFVKLAGLDEDEMLRVKELIVQGKWKLAAALGWKSTALTYAHNLRQLCDRALAAGGKYTLDLGDWQVVVTRKTVNPDKE